MATIRVRHRHGDRFDVRIRAHDLTTDQPLDAGGEDLGPTPTELFVASLAACVGYYAERYLRRHALPVEGLEVDAGFEMGERPARVTSVVIDVRLPRGFPSERLEALSRVVEHCTVHNSIRRAPEVRIGLGSREDRAA